MRLLEALLCIVVGLVASAVADADPPIHLDRWKTLLVPNNHYIFSMQATGPDTFIAASSNSSIFLVNATDGTPVWKYQLRSTVPEDTTYVATFLLPNTTLAFVANCANHAIIDTNEGQEVRTATTNRRTFEFYYYPLVDSESVLSIEKDDRSVQRRTLSDLQATTIFRGTAYGAHHRHGELLSLGRREDLVGQRRASWRLTNMEPCLKTLLWTSRHNSTSPKMDGTFSLATMCL